MFRRRRTTPATVPAAWVTARDKTIAEHEAVIKAFGDGIDALIDSHAPRTGASAREHVHPGWLGDRIVFYCDRCSTQWPCRAINDLRNLYGEATGWEAATVPYAPLTLRLDTPENMTVGDQRRKDNYEKVQARRAERAAQRAAEPEDADSDGADS